MTIAAMLFISGLLLLGGWLFYQYYPRKGLLGRRLLINLGCGGAVMLIMNAISGVTALSLPLNLLSIMTGTILGAPGMLGLYAIKLLL